MAAAGPPNLPDRRRVCIIGHSRVPHARLSQILDLFAEERWRRVYAGELKVRPPGAPTTGQDTEERGTEG